MVKAGALHYYELLNTLELLRTCRWVLPIVAMGVVISHKMGEGELQKVRRFQTKCPLFDNGESYIRKGIPSTAKDGASWDILTHLLFQLVIWKGAV